MNTPRSPLTWSVISGLALFLSLAIASGASATGTPKPPSTVALLPMLPGATSCDAFDINDADVIVGLCFEAGIPQPVRWLPDAFGGYQLELLTAPIRVTAPDGSTTDLEMGSGQARGINASGQIAGAVVAAGGGRTRAVVWENGVWYDRGLPAGATAAAARDIDDQGRLIGNLSRAGLGYAAIWSSQGIVELPHLPGTAFCIGFAGNEIGDVVGSCDSADGSISVPVVWRKGKVYELQNPRVPPGEFGVGASFARTINENGQVGGTAGSAAHVWKSNLPGRAAVIADTGTVTGNNDREVLVGFLGVNGGDPSQFPQGAWWRNATQPPVLFMPGYEISFPRAINRDGVVVGTLYPGDGTQHAFVAR